MVQDLSTYRARTISFVDNLLPFEDDDSSLRIFLPSQPSSVPLQEVRNERDNMSDGVQPDDWISLTLAAGGGGTEQSEPAVTVNPQPQIPVKERSVEPSSDAGTSLSYEFSYVLFVTLIILEIVSAHPFSWLIRFTNKLPLTKTLPTN
jgi:hypothetical protein